MSRRKPDDEGEGNTPEQKKLLLMKQRYTYARDEWRDIRKESLRDRRCLTPDGPWDEKDRADRINAGRPVLTLDEVSQYANQVVNDVLLNQRAIKVTPVGNGATDDTARMRANLIRQIQYRSNAEQIYSGIFEGTVTGSYGFGRVTARYVSPSSFDQELVMDWFPNPDLVTPDPDFLKPDLSDCKYWFVLEPWRHDEFRAKFPKATIQNFDADLISKNAGWLTNETVLVGEYWTIEHVDGKLYQLRDPQTGEEMPFTWYPGLKKSGQPVPEPDESLVARRSNGQPAVRDVQVPKVMKYITNGLEFLETVEWPGKYIPLVGCLGKVVYVGTNESNVKRQIHSLIRMGRDPYMLWCYYKSTEAELVGMTPKTPYIGYVGQFRSRASEWQTVNHAPLPYVEADAKTEATGEALLPLPVRQQYSPAIEPLEIGGESARRSIMSAMSGAPLPTSAQRRNEKSGVALKQIEASAQRGTAHLVHHLDQMITRFGLILDDLLDHYYDTMRDVTVRDPGGKVEQVRINDPSDPKSLKFGAGYEHDVTISVGPSQDSEREAASDFADMLASNPQVFPLLGPLIIKLKNLGPIGDEMADLLKFMQPPEVRAAEDAKKNGGQAPPIPPEVQQKIAAMEQELGKLQQMLQTDAAKQQASVAIAQGKAATDLERTKIDAAAKIEVERIRAASDQVIAEMKDVRVGLDQQMEALRAILATLHHPVPVSDSVVAG